MHSDSSSPNSATWIPHWTARWLTPKYGLYFLMLFLPFLPQAPQGIGWLEVIYILVFGVTGAGWALNVLTGRAHVRQASESSGVGRVSRLIQNIRAGVPLTTTAWTVAVFVVICLANLPVALSHGTTAGEWGRGLIPFLNLVIFFVAATELRTYEDRRNFLVCSLIAGLIIASQGIWLIINKQLWMPVIHTGAPGKFYAVYNRLTWFFGSGTSPLLPVGTVILLGAVLLARRLWQKIALVALGTPILWIILWTWSRTTLLALAAGLAGFVALYGMKKYWAELRDTLLVFAATAALAWLFFFALDIPILSILAGRLVEPLNAETINRVIAAGKGTLALQDDEEDATVDPNLVYRAEEYSTALNAFRQQPLWGMGLGYHFTMMQADINGKMQPVSLTYVHNFLAYFLMTTGIVGTAAYLALIAAAALEFFRVFRKKLARSEFAILVVIGLAGVVLLADAFFFAVFRLIGFNLFLGASLGILAGYRATRVEVTEPAPAPVEAQVAFGK